ncbi:hypothetical protein AgCh_010181 [Apium graveolens]
MDTVSRKRGRPRVVVTEEVAEFRRLAAHNAMPGIVGQKGQSVYSPFVPVSGAPLEHKFSMISPSPVIRIRQWQCPPTIRNVPKILLGITKQSDGPSDSLTPEKKLLNSIEKVEKVVTQELNRLKRTHAAKRAEREKKVRTLMSMR